MINQLHGIYRSYLVQINIVNRDGDFVDLSVIADFFFSASNLPDICRFLQFRAFRTLIREREMRKKMLKNNPNTNRASD